MTTRQEMDEATAQRFERAREERAFWERHYRELLAKYPDEFVSALDGEVVAHRFCLRDLLRDLEEQDIDVRETWVEFMNASRRSVTLRSAATLILSGSRDHCRGFRPCCMYRQTPSFRSPCPS